MPLLLTRKPCAGLHDHPSSGAIAPIHNMQLNDLKNVEGLAVAAVIVLLALIATVALLYLNRKPAPRGELRNLGPAADGGTHQVVENGMVVRRSTR